MHSNPAVWTGSAWLTYSLQVLALYILIRCLCWVVPAPRVRFRLWAMFLGFVILAWLMLIAHLPTLGITAAIARHSPGGSASFPSPIAMHGSWEIAPWMAAYLNRISFWLTRFYLAVLGGLLLRTFIKSWRLRRAVRSARPAPANVELMFDELRHELGIGAEVGILSGIRSPAMAGWLRPRVLLPEGLLGRIGLEALSDILRHELFHVRRRDYLWDRLASLGCQIVFFHPVVWLAYRRLTWERELVCDEAVVEHRGERRVEYADCLATLARWWYQGSKGPAVIDFASYPSLMATRVRALLSEPRAHSRLRSVTTSALTASTLGLGMWIFLNVGITVDSSSAVVRRPFGPPEASHGFRALTGRERGPRGHTQQLFVTTASANASGSGFRSTESSEELSVNRYSGAASVPSKPGSNKDTFEVLSEPIAQSDSNAETGSKRPAWDESIPGSDQQTPSWKSVAIGAASSSITLIPGAGGSSGGPGAGPTGPETKDGKETERFDLGPQQ